MSDQEIISNFIHKLLRDHDYDDEVTTSASLILSGLLDSLAVIHIVVFLEEQYDIDFSDVYFDQASFDTIDQILDFVKINRRS
jgi:acyl carrier protein